MEIHRQSNSAGAATPRQNWLWILLLFSITSMVEAYGVSQVLALLSPYLLQLGVSKDDLPTWLGFLLPATFILGLPLVPLWGVWADKYSRKAVIIRSALVETVVFLLVGLAQTPLQLAGSLLLIGFQLGNTGVMLAAVREVAPLSRLGLSISIFGAMGPLGFAIGPIAGGFIHDSLHLSYSQMYFIAATLSLTTGVMLWLGFREVRPEHIPEGSVLSLAYGVIGSVLRVASTRRLFGVFGLEYFGYQIAFTFLPLVILGFYGNKPGLASTIGLVSGGAALVGVIISPFGGLLGDRLGYRRVLITSMIGAGITTLLIPLMDSLPLLLAVVIFFGAFSSINTAMIFSLLAIETPSEKRSSTLNLILFPLYIANIVGPPLAGLVAKVSGSLTLVFALATLFFALAVLTLSIRAAQQQESESTTGSHAVAQRTAKDR